MYPYRMKIGIGLRTKNLFTLFSVVQQNASSSLVTRQTELRIQPLNTSFHRKILSLYLLSPRYFSLLPFTNTAQALISTQSFPRPRTICTQTHKNNNLNIRYRCGKPMYQTSFYPNYSTETMPTILHF